MQSPYSVLEVPEGSSLEVCKSAFRRLSKLYHPDSGGDANKFAMVIKAWKDISSGSYVAPMHRTGVTHVSIFSFREV